MIEKEYGKLLPVSVVCQRLNASRASVYRLIAEGQLALVKVGPKRGYRIPEVALHKFVQEQAGELYFSEE